MKIHNALKHLFPDAKPLEDYLLQNDSDGNGVYIAEWNLGVPQPTQDELQKASADFDAAQAQKEVDANALISKMGLTDEDVTLLKEVLK